MKQTNNEHDVVLDVQNLQVSFHTYAGEVKAVRGIDFYLRQGETLAFVGESGCGKTVTAKAIMQLLKVPPAEIKPGSVINYAGENVLTMDKKRLRDYKGNDVGMIFQDAMTSLNPTMTCGKQIEESLRIHTDLSKEECKQKAIDMLRQVEIPNPEERYRQYPHELSGGMRQRVMIAIALACKPRVMIADEPTTALDVTIQAQIMSLLRELKEKNNTAIILVTHDLGVVANFADRIQVMYAGQVVESGTTRDIFKNPQHPYTWALLKSIPRVDGQGKEELYSLYGTPPDLILPLEGCPFTDRCDYAMQICREQHPGKTDFGNHHCAYCWLHHPQAPGLDAFPEAQTKAAADFALGKHHAEDQEEVQA
ncbi:MAG: ABC transporter ATP-binding protein [Eubacteriales bacterium]|nr:ABC transporter ATP-binding protein [Clostridiales bacterium]MDY5836536.1 ABC transporter ATP-binding protein [Eubacteriales bacterium]